jgi:hypothetical protein
MLAWYVYMYAWRYYWDNTSSPRYMVIVGICDLSALEPVNDLTEGILRNSPQSGRILKIMVPSEPFKWVPMYNIGFQ